MDEALRRIILISDGAVASYKAPPQVVRGIVDRADAKQRLLADAREYCHTGKVSQSKEPQSDLATDIDDLGERFQACKTHRGRLMLIKEAQALSDRLRYAPDRSMVRGTKEWREAIAHDPRTCRVLATIYGVSFGTVRRIKKDAGTLARHGRPKKIHGLRPAEKIRNVHHA